MEKLNITKGEYKNTYATQSTYACVEIGEETVLAVQGIHCYDDRDKETSDIALLCADALNTYNQKPVLPSELLRQRDFLVERLKETDRVLRSIKMSMMAHPDHETGSEFDDMTDSAEDQEILNEAALKAIENE